MPSGSGGLFYQLGKLTAGSGGVGAGRADGGDAGGDASEGLGPDPVDRARNLILLLLAAGVGLAVWFGDLAPSPALVAGLVALAVAVYALADSVVIVQAYEKRALTVLGHMEGLLDPGLHLVWPFVSKTYQFDLRTETLDVPPQEAITRDNSPVVADAVVYMRVMDAERAFLGVEDYRRATKLLAQTTLRATIGDLELDETLSQRDEINDHIQDELDEQTDQWGVRVEAVEVREVTPSGPVVDAMEQQTAAERRRRAMILEAQGERRSAVERAEGERASNVITAQGEKQAQILEAQGDAISTVLRARSAESMGERAIIDRGMDTLSAVGAGDSTTFVLPQELTSLLGRQGRHLTGGVAGAVDAGADAGDGRLESRAFDEETRELLGLDELRAIDVEAAVVDDAAGNGAPGDGDAGSEASGPENGA